MTENEAKNLLIHVFNTYSMMICKNFKDDCIQEAFENAITALEEIQQYRAIGTVEEIQERLKSLQSWRDEHLEDITVDLVEYRELCKLEEVAHMKSLKMIIQRNGTIGKILEECAEYEAIGTVEEIKKVVRFLSMDNDNGIIEDLQLLNQYQLIGTVEECGEAMEKQKEMKTGEPYMNGYGNTKAECLNCHCTVMYPSNYCKFCGQKLDWSEVN